MGVRADIWFQKSTDGGRTWLPKDLLIRRGETYAFYPDIATDPDGNVYIEYLFTDTASHTEIVCVHSSDGVLHGQRQPGLMITARTQLLAVPRLPQTRPATSSAPGMIGGRKVATSGHQYQRMAERLGAGTSAWTTTRRTRTATNRMSLSNREPTITLWPPRPTAGSGVM